MSDIENASIVSCIYLLLIYIIYYVDRERHGLWSMNPLLVTYITYYTYKQRPVASVKFGAMWDSWGGFFDESDPGIKPVL